MSSSADTLSTATWHLTTAGGSIWINTNGNVRIRCHNARNLCLWVSGLMNYATIRITSGNRRDVHHVSNTIRKPWIGHWTRFPKNFEEREDATLSTHWPQKEGNRSMVTDPCQLENKLTFGEENDPCSRQINENISLFWHMTLIGEVYNSKIRTEHQHNRIDSCHNLVGKTAPWSIGR